MGWVSDSLLKFKRWVYVVLLQPYHMRNRICFVRPKLQRTRDGDFHMDNTLLLLQHGWSTSLTLVGIKLFSDFIDIHKPLPSTYLVHHEVF